MAKSSNLNDLSNKSTARSNLGCHNAANLTTGTVNNARLTKASTEEEGISQLNDTVTSTSTTQAATANAAKKAYDRASNNAAHVHTSSQIATAIKGIDYNTVGSYVLAQLTTGPTVNPGGTAPGSYLKAASSDGASGPDWALSGTWRAMGRPIDVANSGYAGTATTLWLRIS